MKAERPDNDGREATVKEAGARGGSRTLDLYGREFFSNIGRKGGQRTATLYRHLLSQFGSRGGRPRLPGHDKNAGEGTSNKGGD